MSHIDPTFDPTEVNYPEDDIVLGNNGEEVREPQDAPEPDPTEMERVYDVIHGINNSTRDNLELILNEIDPRQRLAIVALIEEQKMDEHDRLYAKYN